MARVETVDQLREIYRQPKGRAAQKVIPQLEQHSKHIIELSSTKAYVYRMKSQTETSNLLVENLLSRLCLIGTKFEI